MARCSGPPPANAMRACRALGTHLAGGGGQRRDRALTALVKFEGGYHRAFVTHGQSIACSREISFYKIYLLASAARDPSPDRDQARRRPEAPQTGPSRRGNPEKRRCRDCQHERFGRLYRGVPRFLARLLLLWPFALGRCGIPQSTWSGE